MWRGPNEEYQYFYTDNSLELTKAMQSIGPHATSVQHDTSLPYRPTTNSEIEAVYRFVLEGTRCILIQAGLPSPFWPYAVRYFCLSRNVLKPYGDDGSTPWWNRFEEAFQALWSNSTKRQPGTLTTFGSLVKFLPSKTKTSENRKCNQMPLREYSWDSNLLSEANAEA